MTSSSIRFKRQQSDTSLFYGSSGVISLCLVVRTPVVKLGRSGPNQLHPLSQQNAIRILERPNLQFTLALFSTSFCKGLPDLRQRFLNLFRIIQGRFHWISNKGPPLLTFKLCNSFHLFEKSLTLFRMQLTVLSFHLKIS